MKKLMIFFGTMPFFVIGQTTVNIEPPTDDAFVYEANPTTNYGSSNNLSVGYDGNGKETRVLIKWDLSSLPSNIIIDKAEIRLYQWSTNSSIGANLCRIIESWNESLVTWNNQPTCTGWYGTKTFSNSGLHFIPATDLVKDWLIYGNNGVMLTITSGTSYQTFESKEESGSDPRLIITYTIINEVKENEFENLKIHLENGKFIIELSENFNLKVFDIFGKLIIEKESFEKTEIDLSEKGVYILRIETSKGIVSKKIIVK